MLGKMCTSVWLWFLTQQLHLLGFVFLISVFSVLLRIRGQKLIYRIKQCKGCIGTMSVWVSSPLYRQNSTCSKYFNILMNMLVNALKHSSFYITCQEEYFLYTKMCFISHYICNFIFMSYSNMISTYSMTGQDEHEMVKGSHVGKDTAEIV